MMKTRLPPLVGEIKDGNVILRKIEDNDYKTLGDVLNLHLIIEDYMDKFIQINCSKLDWASARLRFIDKIRLLSKYPNGEKNILTPTLYKFNDLRNKFSHKINYKLTDEDVEPFTLFLSKFIKKGEAIPTNKIEILSDYTSLVCFWLAQVLELTVKNNWAKRRGKAIMKGLKEGLGITDRTL